MSQADELIELEHAAWKALSSHGDEAARFFSEVLARHVLMLLSGGLVIDDRAEAIDSMGGAPWTSFELADERVLGLTEDSAVVAYRATARPLNHATANIDLDQMRMYLCWGATKGRTTRTWRLRDGLRGDDAARGQGVDARGHLS